jgi:hypothetical protein
MTIYVVAEAADGYRVVFSLAELDPGIRDSDVIVADTLDGTPLDAKHGPFSNWSFRTISAPLAGCAC